jgi:hypothetical protein
MVPKGIRSRLEEFFWRVIAGLTVYFVIRMTWGK